MPRQLPPLGRRGILAPVQRVERCGPTAIVERDAISNASGLLRRMEPEIQARLQKLGRPLGPPWRQDEKLAALVAWLALAAAANH
jgi:hypothetical protein